ncbi:MAG: Uncharacterized protein G01um101472_279 [Parcubacteria group bacterium Gr01-1014_72]|nr:MAG: Uncharacterized protein G01um101472_279 [Parcubacteria group bacterium Gr01-1014_72]
MNDPVTDFIQLFQDEKFLRLVSFLRLTAPVWLPLTLLSIFMRFWLRYIRSDFFAREGYKLLEVKLPREIFKSPRAMEMVFNNIWQRGSVTYFDTYRDGKVRPWFSFEIASFGGEIHFFVWTLPKYRNLIESNIYSQYPTVEIFEVPDYTIPVRFNPEKRFMWGTYFQFTKSDSYPIKTYVDYGLDKEMTEEEQKIDPLTAVIEYMGSLKKGEQLWFQIAARAHSRLGLLNGHLFPRADWQKEGRDEIDKILLRNSETKGSRQLSPTGFPIIPTLTEGEKRQAEAIERSLDKLAYECAVRFFYIAEKEVEDLIPLTIAGLVGIMRQYNSIDLNGFKLGWYTDLADLTKDFFSLFFIPKRIWDQFQQNYARRFLDAYKRRSYFYPPYRFFKQTPLILTVEELATIYHFPGSVATTPTFGRILSKRAEPPPNLPV